MPTNPIGLCLAAQKNNVKLMQNYIQEGTDINATIEGGIGAIHYAAKFGSLEALGYIINEKNANLNLRTSKNKTALDIAKKHNQIEAQRTLESALVKLQIALLNAAKTNNVDEAKACLTKGADVNFKYENNYTVLHHACELGHLEMTHFLVSARADEDAETVSSKIPLNLIPNSHHGRFKEYMQRKMEQDTNSIADSIKQTFGPIYNSLGVNMGGFTGHMMGVGERGFKYEVQSPVFHMIY